MSFRIPLLHNAAANFVERSDKHKSKVAHVETLSLSLDTLEHLTVWATFRLPLGWVNLIELIKCCLFKGKCLVATQDGSDDTEN